MLRGCEHSPSHIMLLYLGADFEMGQSSDPNQRLLASDHIGWELSTHQWGELAGGSLLTH